MKTKHTSILYLSGISAVLTIFLFLWRIGGNIYGENPESFFTVCGGDERKPSSDIPVGRLYNSKSGKTICTAWRASNGVFVTAAHCLSPGLGFDEIHFTVPDSLCDGTPVLPPASHRFKINAASIKSKFDMKTRQDWAIFTILYHPGTELPEILRKGYFFTISNEQILKNKPVQVDVSGFGDDFRKINHCLSKNRTLQTDSSSGYLSDGWFTHSSDTRIGSSGSPVYRRDTKGNLLVYGIHRGGNCPNISTTVLSPDFRKALNEFNEK